jgi:hypothetical protein
MPRLYLANPGHNEAIVLSGLGTKLLQFFSCGLRDGCAYRGVAGEDGTRSTAPKACSRPTNPATPQHVGIRRVTDGDDPNRKRHQLWQVWHLTWRVVPMKLLYLGGQDSPEAAS